MEIAQMAKAMGLTQIAGFSGDLHRAVEGCYIGDLLSWVMGRASSGDAWITVMGNINGIAVAVLADVSCIILAENAALDEDAAQKAEEQQVPVYITEKSSYTLAAELSRLLG